MTLLENDWIDVTRLRSHAARRFAEYCLYNWQAMHDSHEDFDETLYQEAIQLTLDRLEHAFERESRV